MSNIISRSLILLRNKFSTIMEYKLKSTNWEPDIPKLVSDIPNYMQGIFTWKQDPLWGLCDYIQPIGYMNWQLENNRHIYGDCDDYAQYIARILYRLNYRILLRVNMLDKKHVILAFMENDKGFSVFSNSNYITNNNTNADQAIIYYCDQDSLSKISAGRKLTIQEAKDFVIENRSTNYVVEPLIWNGKNMVVRKK